MLSKMAFHLRRKTLLLGAIAVTLFFILLTAYFVYRFCCAPEPAKMSLQGSLAVVFDPSWTAQVGCTGTGTATR